MVDLLFLIGVTGVCSSASAFYAYNKGYSSAIEDLTTMSDMIRKYRDQQTPESQPDVVNRIDLN